MTKTTRKTASGIRAEGNTPKTTPKAQPRAYFNPEEKNRAEAKKALQSVAGIIWAIDSGSHWREALVFRKSFAYDELHIFRQRLDSWSMEKTNLFNALRWLSAAHRLTDDELAQVDTWGERSASIFCDLLSCHVKDPK